ncbi:MAG: protease Lon-related BREX system protein BrxL [Ignavibacteria bacterium]
MEELKSKINSVFSGKVVRKDLVRKVKVGANVPVYVLEYLLGKYCASDDSNIIEAGLKLVNNKLSENYVRPDENMKAQSKVKLNGKHTFIDKISVRLVASEDKYWATLVNFGYKNVHIAEREINKYDRLLQGGIWAEIELEYLYEEEGKGTRSPFRIRDLRPIQIASFDMNEYIEGRKKFSTDEWIDLLILTIGLEPSKFEKRVKLHYLSRLIPLIENNYNFVELGPRGTGKSYAFQDISPYCILLTGPTTVANLFYNISKSQMGLVGTWDAVAFDEIADLQSMPKEVITSLKTYCESGAFARGKESLAGKASIAFFGNTNQPVDVMVQSSHLFAPMPDVIREDLAFLDRIHYYLPGWEISKMSNDFLTDNYGFVVDYFAEAIKELRSRNFSESIDKHFILGTHLNTRDTKAVRKTVSGLLKLIHPNGEFSKEELKYYAEFAIEGRRRVKEQLKKLAPYEYSKTSFSIIDKETLEEMYVGVPEAGGKGMISSDPLAPGTVYTIAVGEQSKVSIYRIEVNQNPGTGKLRTSGSIGKQIKDSFNRAFEYLKSVKNQIGIGSEIYNNDFNVEAVDLLGTSIDTSTGVAFFVAMVSLIKRQSVLPGLIILGDMTVQGNIKPLSSLAEPLQVGLDNGAKKAIIPIENKRLFFEISSDIVEAVDPIFYKDPTSAVFKGLGIS